jgi:uncharacterized protein (DUF2147 family)
MKHIYAGLAALALSVIPAAAQEPTGEWVVEEGYARVRIENCSGRLWGFVAWEKTPGVDSNNPDPSKRTRPTLGLPILLNMKPGDGRWEGEIYNTQDGRTWNANIKLLKPDVLRVEGCVLGFLCGGQSWTRYKPTETRASTTTPSARDYCARVAGGRV